MLVYYYHEQFMAQRQSLKRLFREERSRLMQGSTTSEPSRHLPLSGTCNVRDIGGYRTHDGRYTRWHTFFRADSLHRLSPEAQTTLLDHGVRTVIDLRRADELATAPNVFADSTTVRYRHLSLLGDGPQAPGDPKPLLDTYRQMLDERQEQICEILQVLAAPGGLPAVVHCTAGKDRTGVIVALALGLAGVPEATIVKDYELTAKYLGGTLVEEIRRRALAKGYTWEQYKPLLQCPPDYMYATLRHLHERYSGIETYVRSIGVGREDLERLRAALVA
jgi:protein-tyrosine phosphatase